MITPAKGGDNPYAKPPDSLTVLVDFNKIYIYST